MLDAASKTILVTGGCGFIGSNFISYMLKNYNDYRIVNLDLLTYAGDINNLSEIESDQRYNFIEGDICNRELVESIFSGYCINGVINFAAESHVDNSIKKPEVFIETNIKGTFTLIDVAYKHWLDEPFSYKSEFEGCRFHQISTDEIFGSLDETGLFKEDDPYAPNSPYSASKASADMVVRSYHKTFGVNTVTTSCSNNYGPKQHAEKLIPTIIRKALSKENIPIYGDGKNIRDWLYVTDHCKAIDLVFHNGIEGELYNIGGNNERTNLQIVDRVCSILDKKKPLADDAEINSYKNLITFVQDRAGHDKRYAIDASKLKNNLNWVPDENFESGISKTIDWYLENYLS